MMDEDISDDGGWGFYVVIDTEQHRMSSLKYYIQKQPYLETIHECEEYIETNESEPHSSVNKASERFKNLNYIYTICIVYCLSCLLIFTI
jgi:hypothetical protein